LNLFRKFDVFQEIDVQSVELLPEASSTLYMVPMPLMVSCSWTVKSPFTSQGITAYAKLGQNQPTSGGTNDYVDYGIRMAHAFSPETGES
jgi:hypothetical protein